MRTSKILGLAAAAILTAATTTAASGHPATAAQQARACTSWQLMPAPPAPGTGAALGSVTAISAGDVVFTGNATETSGGLLLGPLLNGPYPVSSPWVLHWDGHSVTEGTQVPADPVRGTSGANADTTGWISAFDSAADGWTFTSPDVVIYTGDATAEHWHDGHWTLTPLQTTPQATLSNGEPKTQIVRAAAALSPDDAWAVGYLGVSNLSVDELYDVTDTPLIEHWDGTQWQVIPAAAPALSAGELLGIAAVSPGDIWAVGVQYVPGNPSGAEPLLEHWDGTAWTTVPAPSGQDGSYLQAVSAASGDDVWAVGTQDGSGSVPLGSVPLAEHWDGSAWAVQQVPDIEQGFLTSVYAASPGDVWALGQQVTTFTTADGNNQYQSVFLHWDGETWTTVPLPGPQEYGLTEEYTAIAGGGPGDVWAAGAAYDNGNGALDPLIAHLGCQ